MMKILIQGTNWIGDAIMSIPAMMMLRSSFPDARIALHTRSWAEGIFKDAEFIDEILPYERTESTFRDARVQAKLLRQKRFDVAVAFPNSFVSGFTSWLARVPRRFGYATEGRRLLLTDPVQVPEWRGKRHEVFYYLKLAEAMLEALNAETCPAIAEQNARLNVSTERRDSARVFLSSKGADHGRKTVALGVGSANSRAKRWPAESYAKLNDYLQMELNANVIILGASNECDVADQVVQLSNKKPINLSGKTSLDTVTAVLSETDLLISNDMGLAHIAPAVGTRTVVIFGPTDPETTRPYSENATIIRKMVECSPCMLRNCPIDHRCMTGVGVEEVLDHARIILTDGIYK